MTIEHGNIAEVKFETEQKALDKAKELDISDGFLNARLYKMIEYGIGRVDWYEEQRNKVLNVGFAFFALATGILAFLGAAFNFVPNQFPAISFALSICSAITLIFTGLSILYEYVSLISADPAHRTISDIRSWYFIYNFPDDIDFHLKTDNPNRLKQTKEVSKAYLEFIDRWSEFATKEKAFLSEDLQQVFILQMMQRYRRQSLAAMRRKLELGTILFIFFIALSSITYFTGN